MKWNILYQFNEKYVPFAATSIASVINNNKGKTIRFFILGEGLSQESTDKLKSMISDAGYEYDFLETASLIAKMKEMNMPTYRDSYAANMRLFLDDLVDVSVEKILYLDADTVVNASLDNLFELDLQGYPLGMAMDSLGELHKEEIGLEGVEGYYNSGVILFDMKRWRELKLSDRIVDHVKNVRAQYPSPDQDLLNVVCKGEIFTLPIEYNFQPIHVVFKTKTYFRHYGKTYYYSYDEVERGKANPVIFHFFRFIGEFPWNENNYHPDNDLFDKYIKMTPWQDYRKQKAELGFAIRCEKIMYRCMPKGLFIVFFKTAHRMFYSKANKLSQKNVISKKM